jgi:hypothetical protein
MLSPVSAITEAESFASPCPGSLLSVLSGAGRPVQSGKPDICPGRLVVTVTHESGLHFIPEYFVRDSSVSAIVQLFPM